jgi:hypothetical protein
LIEEKPTNHKGELKVDGSVHKTYQQETVGAMFHPSWYLLQTLRAKEWLAWIYHGSERGRDML